MLVQPTRFPGTAGMPAGMLATAPTQPSIRQWAISGVLPYILIRTQILQIRDCQEQRRTLRARRHAIRIHELIRLHVRLPESYGILPESKYTLRSADTQSLQSSGTANCTAGILWRIPV